LFRKILIANRGEIAIRILRACHSLGIRTVAVYSDADRTALHVRYADEAYRIGPAPAQDSYLYIDRILDVTRQSGAEAVHPGYGFLAENSEFAQACAEAGLTFVGPPASAIAAMGDKIMARRLMEQAGVPVIPGTESGLSDSEMWGQAESIGYPLFVKAAAGGGGKGMRLVHTPHGLKESLGAARREAQKAFGDDRVYLERAIEGARHVEIQVLADSFGSVIHLGERECSIQRRHQKLIEEAPSPAVDEALRQQMGRVAVQAAAAVGYVNAGTVEFLLAADHSYYFLEMNTRLQVEHPVTEAVTGIDIVAEQLRIAAGEPLGLEQSRIQVRGWAIECRITAEDPFNDFLPASGRIIRLSQPSGPGIRVDGGIYEGFESSLFYDSLLQKVIVWGSSRAEAMQRMRQALRELRIIGLQTSTPFHEWVMTNERFLEGSYSTSFFQDQFATLPEQGRQRRLAAIVAALVRREQGVRRGPGSLPCPDEGATDASRLAGQGLEKSWKLAGRWEALGR
jgi:acetyl-CoA carboxylase biotin carboxylase subunit